MEQILKSISSFLWGAPVLILLAAVGLLFGCKTKFFQFRKFGYILKNTAGEMFKKGGGAKGKEGTLTPLQAVSSALAGCVGTANIAGVATAMVVGGPGAVFWMWVVALLGMLTKCVEVTLGQYYRVKGEDGVYYGGPMYYIERGMGRKWKPLAVIFSVTIILGGLGTAAFAQPYTMSTAVQNSLGIPAWITTVAAAVICGVVLLGPCPLWAVWRAPQLRWRCGRAPPAGPSPTKRAAAHRPSPMRPPSPITPLRRGCTAALRYSWIRWWYAR